MIEDLSVDTALEIAEEVRDSKSLESIVKAIVLYLAMAGKFDRALKLTNKFDILPLKETVELSYDDKEKAKSLFEKILPDIEREHWTYIIMSGLSKNKKIELLERLNMKKHIESSDFAELAKCFAKLGEVDKALEYLNKSLDKHFNVGHIIEIAEELYIAGCRREALDLFEEAFNIGSKDNKNKDEIYKHLAKSLTEVKVKEIDFALRVAEKIDWKRLLKEVLENIILLIYWMDKVEYADRAFELANRLSDCDKRELIENIITVVLSLFANKELLEKINIENFIEKIDKLVNSITDAYCYEKCLNVITILKFFVCIAKGNYDRALELAESFDDEEVKNRFIAYSAYKFASKDSRKVKSLLETLNDDYDQWCMCYKSLCYIKLNDMDKFRESFKKLVSSICYKEHAMLLLRVLLEILDKYEYGYDYVTELLRLVPDNYKGIVAIPFFPIFDGYIIDPYYKSGSIIFRILTSYIKDNEKIKYINKIYEIAKNLDDDIGKNNIFGGLAVTIAWYSLKDEIKKRARKLEERGYLEKAIELYKVVDSYEIKRLKGKLVNVQIETPNQLGLNERGKLRVKVSSMRPTYDIKIDFRVKNVRIYRNGKEINSFSIPSIVGEHEEDLEVIPSNSGVGTIQVDVTFNYFDDIEILINEPVWRILLDEDKDNILSVTYLETKTVTRSMFINIKETKSKIIYKISKNETSTQPLDFPSQLLTKYEPLKLIGEGGFVKVFKCRRKSDGKLVAVKIPEESEEAGKSFIEEVVNWKRLKHINIVQVYNYNALPYPYIEVELCDFTLRDLPKLTLKERFKIACRIADALSYAHGRGVIHGDLKPSNVLIKHIDNGIIPKLTDWGMGYTPAYSPPEVVVDGKKPDMQTDVWSFGVILYELVTGKNPFQGEDEIETVERIAELEIDLVPLGVLKHIVAKCLERDRDKRYKSMIEVRKDLAELNVSTLSYLSLNSKERKERSEIAIEIFRTYVSTGEFNKAEKKLESLVKYKYITPQAHEVYRTLIEIMIADELTLSFLDSKFKHIFEILPEYKREFEEDEYIGKLFKEIVAHRKDVCEIIKKGEEEYDIIKNIICPRILDLLSRIALDKFNP